MKLRINVLAAVVLASAPVFADEDRPPESGSKDATSKDASAKDDTKEAPADERLAPLASPAPATEAATHGVGPFRAGFELFAQYTYRNLEAQNGSRTFFHLFDVPRVHAALDLRDDVYRGRVVLEAVRSSAEGALIGVAGDSLVLRLREAYGAVKPWKPMEIAAGVVPTLTIPELDGTWMLRAVAPSLAEQSALQSPADLGVRIRADLPNNWGYGAAAVYNGEGYTGRELNRGKSTEFAAAFRPNPSGPLAPLALFGSLYLGSSGVLAARSDRATASLLWQGERVRAGVSFIYGWGYALAGDQRAWGVSAYARVEPIKRILVGLRGDYFERDASAAADAVVLFTSAGYRFRDYLEAHVVFGAQLPNAAYQGQVPGSSFIDARTVLRVYY